jgi:hypothetical protein
VRWRLNGNAEPETMSFNGKTTADLFTKLHPELLKQVDS